MKKRRTLVFSPQIDSMIEDLKTHRGDKASTHTIMEAIRFLHDKTFPAYKPRKKEQVVGAGICDLLNGTVNEEGNCVYYKYTERDRYEMTVPVRLLTNDMIDTQYSPSKTEVVELQKQGKTNY